MASPSRRSWPEQVKTNFQKLKDLPGFASDRVWLTFYLSALPKNLNRLASNLSQDRWVNLSGSEGGFLYPKVQVEQSVDAILAAIKTTQERCSAGHVTMLHVDADTSADVTSSTFVTLCHFD